MCFRVRNRLKGRGRLPSCPGSRFPLQTGCVTVAFHPLTPGTVSPLLRRLTSEYSHDFDTRDLSLDRVPGLRGQTGHGPTCVGRENVG